MARYDLRRGPDMLHLAVELSLGVAAFTALLCCINLFFFQAPPALRGDEELPPVTVILPARNEEPAIEACVRSVLASESITLECIAANDHSTDRTGEICDAIAAADARLRVLNDIPALPAGWNGKQHACWVAAQQAGTPLLLFMDADVRLAPQAIARMAAELQRTRAALVSGFPHQVTVTLLEKMLIPLIQYLLLGYLPFPGMRYTRAPGFAAGCGQFLLVRHDAYFASGGHAAIRSTMHDGLKLPRLLRQHGYWTTLADIDRLAVCRMYRSAGEVWRGLGKNATEGIASVTNIVPFSILLTLGQILPLLLALATHGADRLTALAAVGLSYAPRIMTTWRFQQSWLSALLHPVDIAVLLALQWWSFLRKLAGRQPVWKQRAYDAG